MTERAAGMARGSGRGVNGEHVCNLSRTRAVTVRLASGMIRGGCGGHKGFDWRCRGLRLQPQQRLFQRTQTLTATATAGTNDGLLHHAQVDQVDERAVARGEGDDNMDRREHEHIADTELVLATARSDDTTTSRVQQQQQQQQQISEAFSQPLSPVHSLAKPLPLSTAAVGESILGYPLVGVATAAAIAASIRAARSTLDIDGTSSQVQVEVPLPLPRAAAAPTSSLKSNVKSKRNQNKRVALSPEELAREAARAAERAAERDRLAQIAARRREREKKEAEALLAKEKALEAEREEQLKEVRAMAREKAKEAAAQAKERAIELKKKEEEERVRREKERQEKIEAERRERAEAKAAADAASNTIEIRIDGRAVARRAPQGAKVGDVQAMDDEELAEAPDAVVELVFEARAEATILTLYGGGETAAVGELFASAEDARKATGRLAGAVISSAAAEVPSAARIAQLSTSGDRFEGETALLHAVRRVGMEAEADSILSAVAALDEIEDDLVFGDRMRKLGSGSGGSKSIGSRVHVEVERDFCAEINRYEWKPPVLTEWIESAVNTSTNSTKQLVPKPPIPSVSAECGMLVATAIALQQQQQQQQTDRDRQDESDTSTSTSTSSGSGEGDEYNKRRTVVELLENAIQSEVEFALTLETADNGNGRDVTSDGDRYASARGAVSRWREELDSGRRPIGAGTAACLDGTLLPLARFVDGCPEAAEVALGMLMGKVGPDGCGSRYDRCISDFARCARQHLGDSHPLANALVAEASRRAPPPPPPKKNSRDLSFEEVMAGWDRFRRGGNDSDDSANANARVGTPKVERAWAMRNAAASLANTGEIEQARRLYEGSLQTLCDYYDSNDDPRVLEAAIKLAKFLEEKANDDPAAASIYARCAQILEDIALGAEAEGELVEASAIRQATLLAFGTKYAGSGISEDLDDALATMIVSQARTDESLDDEDKAALIERADGGALAYKLAAAFAEEIEARKPGIG